MASRIAVFELAGYRYGVAEAATRGFLRVPSIVPLPEAPLIVEGVVNIRGTVVPVLDIRKRFRLPAKPPHPADHLVLAQAGSRLVALRVDRVLGIEDVDPKDIADAAALTQGAQYVAGVAKLPEGLVVIHDLSTFLAEAEGRDFDAALENSSVALP
jgi:purine-binding chemotaxis protein CheW